MNTYSNVTLLFSGEISNQLRLSNAQLVFTNADLYANVQQAIKQTATNIKTAVVKQSVTFTKLTMCP